MAELNEKKMALTDEELEGVAGGLIFDASNIYGADPTHPWEVLDNHNGNVLGRFTNITDAQNYVRSMWGNDPENTMPVNWDQVCYLRGQR
ncbi:MAG: hypothetical protein K6D90_08375 [Lachnospiraceae bacterium]|nr:hypothetical protein [Lachnospiraceae bacterium]